MRYVRTSALPCARPHRQIGRLDCEGNHLWMTALNIGNTLILLPNDGFIEEADSSWNALQTLQAISFGYPDWRESLCGPPSC